MTESIIKPLTPRAGTGWQQGPKVPPFVSLGFDCEAWYHPETGLSVLSAVEVAKDDDGVDRGPEYHISIAKRLPTDTAPRRCTSQEAQTVLEQFGMDGAEEDNHVPNGIARNFWRPVADRFVGLECACKEAEPAIVEDKGDYVWRGVPGGSCEP